jgi:hypothetical protein
VVLRQFPVNSLLPGGIVDIPPRFAFKSADLDGDGRTFIKEPDDSVVQPIDPFPQFLQQFTVHGFISSRVSRRIPSGTPPLMKGIPIFLIRT